MAIEESFNFRRINASLTTSGVVGAQRLAELAAAGYQQLINLLPDSSEYAVAEERAIVESQGLIYHHIPVDFARPTAADFDAFCAVMAQAQGCQLHIHCAANYRVSAFYARYAVAQGQWSAGQAQALIRGLWNPAEHPGWSAFLQDLDTAPADLTHNYLRLSQDGRIELLPVDGGFWQRLSNGELGDFHHQYLVSQLQFETDWAGWEMHPHGDEMVCLLSGAAHFVLRENGADRIIELRQAGSFVRVPQGTWHTARTDQATSLLFITAGEGTEHRASPPSEGAA